MPVWLATLQLKNDPTDFSENKFIAFEHCIYSNACRNLDYYLINVHFTIIFDGFRATSSSDSFFTVLVTRIYIGHSFCILCFSTIVKTDWNKGLCFKPIFLFKMSETYNDRYSWVLNPRGSIFGFFFDPPGIIESRPHSTRLLIFRFFSLARSFFLNVLLIDCLMFFINK